MAAVKIVGGNIIVTRSKHSEPAPKDDRIKRIAYRDIDGRCIYYTGPKSLVEQQDWPPSFKEDSTLFMRIDLLQEVNKIQKGNNV